MDKVYVEGMEFYGYHGVFTEENKLGQRFKVDLTAELDLSKAGQTDDLEQTINYAELYHVCKDIVEGEPVKLGGNAGGTYCWHCSRKISACSAMYGEVIKQTRQFPDTINQ